MPPRSNPGTEGSAERNDEASMVAWYFVVLTPPTSWRATLVTEPTWRSASSRSADRCAAEGWGAEPTSRGFPRRSR